MPQKLLIIEDDSKIVRTLRLYLEEAGFSVSAIYNGEHAMPAFRRERPDLIILDLNLPGMDGLQVCRILRRESSVPIIMLTARVDEADRLIGLELGADDYIVKPFSPREVVARVRAVLRRTAGELSSRELLQAGDIVLDINTYQTRVANETIKLTPSEFEILSSFLRNPGRVLNRSQLLEQTQGLSYEGYERNIDQHIKNLRRKFRKVLGDNTEIIETIYGVGYRLNISPSGMEENETNVCNCPE